MTSDAQPAGGRQSINPDQRFLTLFLASQSELRAFIGSIVRGRSDFDDVLQETLLTLWQKFDEYDAERSFAAWARGVAANKILKWRQRTHQMPVLSPEAIAIIADSFDRRPSAGSRAADALEQCLQSLPAASRQLLVERYGERWSVERIATNLEKSEAAVYKMLQRLRERLADCLARRMRAAAG